MRSIIFRFAFATIVLAQCTYAIAVVYGGDVAKLDALDQYVHHVRLRRLDLAQREESKSTSSQPDDEISESTTSYSSTKTESSSVTHTTSKASMRSSTRPSSTTITTESHATRTSDASSTARSSTSPSLLETIRTSIQSTKTTTESDTIGTSDTSSTTQSSPTSPPTISVPQVGLTPPAPTHSNLSEKSSDISRRLGLGVGLGLGIPLLLVVIGVIFMGYLRNQRQSRGEHLRKLDHFGSPLSEHDVAYNAGEQNPFISGSVTSETQQTNRGTESYGLSRPSTLTSLLSDRRLSEDGPSDARLNGAHFRMNDAASQHIVSPLD